MQHLNGLVATVREHRRYGHPCFVPKPESGDTRLRLCVRWENPNEENSTGALLLEPRFLSLCVRDLQGTPPAQTSSLSVPKTLLTSKRCCQPGLPPSVKPHSVESSALQAVDEVEPTANSSSKVEGPIMPIPSCTGGFLGMLSWLVGAHTRHVEEEFPTVIRLSSVLAAADPLPREQLSWLLPIAEMSAADEADPELVSECTDRVERIQPSCGDVPEPGDLVILECAHSAKFNMCPAVVTGVEAPSCTVAVLDDSRSVFIGECRVNLWETLPVHSEWRLGTHVVLGGLQSSHMTHLNGLSAVICPHKRHGHPCFVQKPSAPNTGNWLTLCIRFDNPEKSSMHAVLLEPRFLSPLENKSLPSPRITECYTPSRPGTPSLQKSTSGAVYARQSSLTSQGSYQKQVSGISQGSHGRRPVQKSRSLQSHPKDPRLQKQPTIPSRSQSSSTATSSIMRQVSSPSATSGESRLSLRERMPEPELIKEIRELKESLKTMTKESASS
ncbi:dld [Symbiodinium pilosum]|uniref:Dld protein n=1 Tax=Symbiodinium pilosum TaxID=2952 RepID=A0A812SIK7_SYMPI|nr:dld [Symbiodinium pilosum]